MFTRDRDLLALEPTLFRDIAWAGQRLLSAAGSVSGTTLTLSTGDAAAAGITTGHVVLIDGLPLEVIERTGPQTLEVSLLRDADSSPAVPPLPLSDRPVVVYTFAPQAAIVHAQLLRAAGIDPSIPGAPDESAVTNADALRLVGALGTLHLIFSAAAALGGPMSHLAARAQLYQHRFRTERARTPVRLDLDGDGETDTIRHLHIYRLLRA